MRTVAGGGLASVCDNRRGAVTHATRPTEGSPVHGGAES
jgi:hypothetical protein